MRNVLVGSIGSTLLMLVLSCNVTMPEELEYIPLDLISMIDRSVSIYDTIIISFGSPEVHISFGSQAVHASLHYIISQTALDINDTVFAKSATYSFDDTGRYEFVVRAFDDENNLYATETFFVTVTSIAPVIKSISGGKNCYVNDTLRFMVTASDSDGSVLSYLWSFDNKVFDTTSGSVCRKVFTTDKAGSKTLFVKVIDDDKFTSQPDSIKFTVLSGVPTVKMVSDTSVTVDDAITFTASASDSNGKIIAYMWSLDGVNFDTTRDSTYTVFSPENTSGIENDLVKAYRLEGVFPKNDTVQRAVLLVKAMDEDSLVSKPVQIIISIRMTVTDRDGNVYNVVRIGSQLWTVENWRATKYNDGTAIPLVTGNSEWVTSTTPGYCYYNNTASTDTIRKFGALYNWYAVASTNPKRIAPPGWRLPDTTDWKRLINYLIASGYNWDGTTTGNKIAKSIAANTDWSDIGAAGFTGNDLLSNNITGFTALPCGFRNPDDGNFYSQSYCSFWWSATEYDTSYAWYGILSFSFQSVSVSIFPKSDGYSVRLVRDVK